MVEDNELNFNIELEKAPEPKQESVASGEQETTAAS